MSRYHVNPATGVVSACAARSRQCLISDDDAHYTSETSARSAYELSYGGSAATRRGGNTGLDVLAVRMIANKLLVPTKPYSEAIDHEAVGSVVVRLTPGKSERSYLMKAENSKWYPILRHRKSGVVSLGVLAYSVLSMEHRGSTEYYFTEIDSQYDEKVRNAFYDFDEAVESIAFRVRIVLQDLRKKPDESFKPLLRVDEYNVSVGSAKTLYEELARELKEEYVDSAKIALLSINESNLFGGIRDHYIPEEIHNAWLKRKGLKLSRANSYYHLSDERKAVSIAIYAEALKVIKQHY